MNLHRSRWQAFSRACTPWVLALVLLAFLAPGISRALGVPGVMAGAGPGMGEDRSGWVEVCGAGGVRWVALDAAASPSPTAE